MIKIFEQGSKVNFVDHNNIFVGYDLTQNCCENAYWFIADDVVQEPISDNDYDVPDLSDWVFDKEYLEYIYPPLFDGGCMVVFRFVNGDLEKFLHLCNSHNGYYSHGFEFKENEEVLEEGYL